jgi:hypothetical protein
MDSKARWSHHWSTPSIPTCVPATIAAAPTHLGKPMKSLGLIGVAVNRPGVAGCSSAVQRAASVLASSSQAACTLHLALQAAVWQLSRDDALGVVVIACTVGLCGVLCPAASATEARGLSSQPLTTP